MNGDCWYNRRFAFTVEPISPPYCWRPLLPLLARVFGFGPVSFTASLATPLVIYAYCGGGWTGFAVAMMFVGNKQLFSFNIKNPAYAEGLGHLIFIASLWAMSEHSAAIFPLMALAALCRESVGAALSLVALFVWPVAILPAAIAIGIAYLSRREDATNRHPLVEKTNYQTIVRWVKVKRDNVLHWTTVIQPLRGLAFTVPWMWGDVTSFARVGLVGFVAFWCLSLPASGASRHLAYGFGLLAPFAAALPGPWLWTFVILSWFWPVDFSTYDESGGATFAYAK